MPISVREVEGYWKAHPKFEGKRRNWSFGSVKTVTRAEAQTALQEKLNSRPIRSNSNPHTVKIAVEVFLENARKLYVRADGSETGQANNLYFGLRPLVGLFGKMRIEEFRPRHIRAFTEQQKEAGVSRQTINARIGMIKLMLLRAKNMELSTPEPYEACKDYEALRAGSDVREAKSIRAVPLPHVEQTLVCLPATLQAMVRLQLATAMRPEEVCALRLVDLDMKQIPWLYIPAWHKTQHRGLQRRIYFGPTAREILQPYLVPGNTHAPVFSPRVAVRERRGKMPQARHVGNSYTTRSYRQAIWFGCDAAFPLPDELKRLAVPARGRKGKNSKRLESVAEWAARLGPENVAKARGWRKLHRWAPNRLRKAGLTAVERAHGKQAAKSIAGHSHVETTTAFYLEQDDSLARTVAEKAG